MTLEVLVCTIDNGIHNIKNLLLAPMDGVISTATHFILRRYKECDIELCGGNVDDRENYSL